MTDLLDKEILAAVKLSGFVAIDIETTGLDSAKEAIIEFGAVRYRDGVPVETMQQLIHPGRAIPPFITRITGIDDELVKEAPSFRKVLPQIRDFIGDAPLIAHNAPFDLGFLEYHARRIENDFDDWAGPGQPYRYFANQQIDTTVLARLYLPYLPSFSLGALVRYLKLEAGEAHRALADARMAGDLFMELLPLALQSKLPDLQKILQILEPTEEPIKLFFERLTVGIATGNFTVVSGIDKATFDIHANHYNIIGETLTPLAVSDNFDPVDVAEVGEFFGAGGDLSRKFGAFEVREAQVNMAKQVARTFNGSSFLAVEAGTGTGKSLAYLIPALRWATSNPGEHGRVVISTNTKNLQEQLFFKDLPVLHSLLGDTFKAVLLKGKSNYLCLDKWTTVMSDMNYRLSTEDRLRMLPLYYWVQQTETGDIAENNGFRVERNSGLWSKFIAENNYCPGKSCKFYDRCFLMRARNNAKVAHLVLVNHSLLFSDLATNNAVLGEYQNLVFDEAHNIEKTATEYLGYEATTWQFRDLFNKLYQKERLETGVLIQLKRRIMAGKLKQAQREGLLRILDQLLDDVQEARRLAQVFFRRLTRHLLQQAGIDQATAGSRQRYLPEEQLFEPLQEEYQELMQKLDGLRKGLGEIVEYYTDIPEDSFEHQRQLYQEVSSKQMQADILQTNLRVLVLQEESGYVYWFELPARADSDDTRLYAAPLDVGNLLVERLYDKLRSAVFTSATLAVSGRFDYFLRRVGLNRVDQDRVQTLMLPSPFQYNEQVLLGVPAFLPEPSGKEYARQLSALFSELAGHRRGMLGLFTNYTQLRDVYGQLREDFQVREIQLLGQGMDGSRHALINRFKEDHGSVLLGTDSFWEGIDVPGDALQMVLITKLPFDVPSDPIIRARSEQIEQNGGKAFRDYTVPEAVIRFRQGFGRLIRSRSDYGAVLITDSRILRKYYGKIFLRSLPVAPRIFASAEEMRDALREWFK